MENWNSARRLAIIATAAFQSPQQQAVLLWAEVFMIDPEDKGLKSLGAAIAERLVWVNEELELLDAHFASHIDYDELYAEPIRRLRNASSPLFLGGAADQVKKQMRSETPRDLRHMAQVIRTDEKKLDASDIEAFERQLAVIRSFINPELAPSLLMVITRHLRLMQRAIDAYPVFGAKAFDDALKDSYVDLAVAVRKFGSSGNESERGAVQAATSGWLRIKERMDSIRTTADLLLTFGKLAELYLKHTSS